jgi:hypothetical protein
VVDGHHTIVSHIRSNDVTQVADNRVKLRWFDRSLRMDLSLLVRDYSPPPAP